MGDRVLHSIRSYTGAIKFAETGINAVKVKEVQANRDELPAAPKLRRQHAGRGSVFFSREDHQIHEGNYDLTDPSNADLVEVAATVPYL